MTKAQKLLKIHRIDKARSGGLARLVKGVCGIYYSADESAYAERISEGFTEEIDRVTCQTCLTVLARTR